MPFSIDLCLVVMLLEVSWYNWKSGLEYCRLVLLEMRIRLPAEMLR